ncbi:MAG: histone deacetylase family protein [Pseudomonadota bacterium]
MSIAIYTHEDCHEHVTPPGHPERVERLPAVLKALEDPAFDAATRLEAPLGEDADILRAHPESYLQGVVSSAPDEGWVSLDPDTHMSPGSLAAARRAVGANAAAVDLVLGGGAKGAFVATRPPGHHAEKNRAMGFCLFANAAIAALRALDQHGLSRVAVADFDVHHGNGTQDVVWDDPRVVFCSSHQSPLYPGTGMPHETGAGNIFNATLPPMSGGAEFRYAWENTLLPAIDEAAPELIIISAGFDAHRDDPLANLLLLEDDFAWITNRLCDLANKHCGGRVVSTLEGGYDLDALASSTATHVQVLMERCA